jgi:ankyrin repeat protein
MKIAKHALKQLRLEANDFSRVIRERDDLRREICSIKRQLDESNKVFPNNMDGDNFTPPRVQTNQKIECCNEAQEVNHLRMMNATKCDKCKEKEEEIYQLKNVIKEMKDEMNDLKNTVERYTSRNLKIHHVRDTKCHSTFSPSRIAGQSLLSRKWMHSSFSTETTVQEHSFSEDMSINMRRECFDNPIHVAIRAADDDALSVAITNCEDVVSELNRSGHDGKTPLHLAISNNNFSSAEFLLQSNDVVANTQDNHGNTPLHYAKHSSFVKLLLESGMANPNIPNERGFCPIHVAVQRRDVDSVNCLLSHHANINVADDCKWLTPLHLAAQDTIHDASFRSNKQSKGSQLRSPAVEITRLLCAVEKPYPADLNYQDKDGNTPLHHASILQNETAGEIMLLLLKTGANPNISNNRGQTPMHLFMHNNFLRSFDFFHDIIHLMLYQGYDTNLQSQNGCTSIHLAIYHRDIDSAISLLERNAQLHLVWNKPTRWETYWKDGGSLYGVLCLDMVEDQETMYRLLSAISCEQQPAPSTRTNCMQCKRKIIGFGKKNCRHCGSTVCTRCSDHWLDPSYFPQYCEEVIQERDLVRVCKLCNEILISRKRESEEVMGREVCFSNHRQEDVSMLDMELSLPMDNREDAMQTNV